MKKIFVATMILILMVGCSAKTDTNEEKNKGKDNEEKKISVIDKLPNFPMPLNTFVKEFNDNAKSNKDVFNKIILLQNPSKLEFKPMNEKDGPLHKVLYTNDTFNINAVFTNDKQFKRVTFVQMSKPDTDTTSALLNIFSILDIDSNYLNDFLESDEKHMSISEKGYKVIFSQDMSMYLLTVSFEKDNNKK
ncbi:hypothetical protein [Heyndrickxia sp. FSL W8-0423]|uniref:hypothetical protein n=1 Tax=Heyndrickxia sp. FSL W8-0423 TaxID=2921601 RepID=UPI0030F80738